MLAILGSGNTCLEPQFAHYNASSGLLTTDTPGQTPAVRTCTQCRRRKTKCDGGIGKCSSCARARKPLECTYDEGAYLESELRKDSLRRGAACIPCRRKKKRCNADRPSCDTCIIAGKAVGCTYKDMSAVSRRQTSTAVTSSTIPPPVAYPQFSIPVFSPFHGVSDSHWFTPLHPVLTRNPVLHLYALTRSESPPSEMHFVFRRIFLRWRQNAGFQFTSAKKEAIIHGDLSHTIIHPFFIHFAHMFGCNLYQERRRDQSLACILDVHLGLAHDAFKSMSEVDDPMSFAQAQLLLALACLYNHELVLGKHFFRYSIRTIRQHSIRFVPQTDGRSARPEFSEEVHERVSFLGEIMFCAVEVQALTGEPDDLLLDLREQLLFELLATYPEVTQICHIVVRAGARTFAVDSVNVLGSYSQQKMPTSECLASCLAHLSILVRQLRNIYDLLEASKSKNDQSTFFSLCFSLSIIEVVLMEIRKMLERHPLTLDSQCKLCNTAINAVNRMLEGVSPEDIHFVKDIHKLELPRGLSLFCDKKRVPAATDPSAPRWPIVQPESPFWDVNIAVMTLCQKKVAKVQMDRFSR